MRLVLASNNAKKLAELRELLSPLGLEIVAQGSLGIAEADEPHATFVENALAKARHAARAAAGAAIADDSGLVVDALGGAPGVRSARYAALLGGATGDAERALRHDLQPERRQQLAQFGELLRVVRRQHQPHAASAARCAATSSRMPLSASASNCAISACENGAPSAVPCTST